MPSTPAAARPTSGITFKIERGQQGEKIAYLRLFSGAITLREKSALGRVTGIQVFRQGRTVSASRLNAGEVGKVWGLEKARVGDCLGDARSAGFAFAPPTLKATVVARHPGRQPALYAALKQLAEQDSLINPHQNDRTLYVSLYGEVQKEIIGATLAHDFGIEAIFDRTQPICIERPVDTAYAVQLLQEERNLTSATVGLRLEPGAPGSGVVFKFTAHPRCVPIYIYKNTGNFMRHMVQYVHDALRQGLHGLQVTDCIITMEECGYYTSDGPRKPVSDTPRTTAADFRKLTPIILHAALRQAGTVRCEPICRFILEAPGTALPRLLPALARLRATPFTTELGRHAYVLKGRIPSARLHDLQQQLPGLTDGEGFLEYEFDRYEPAG